MKRADNATEMQEFLGIATCMSPFVPNLSQRTAPLRDVIEKDAAYEWTASHDVTFEQTEARICRKVTLSYVEPNVDSTIQVDASSRGLRAVLLQKGNLTEALSECEQRYANIET